MTNISSEHIGPVMPVKNVSPRPTVARASSSRQRTTSSAITRTPSRGKAATCPGEKLAPRKQLVGRTPIINIVKSSSRKKKVKRKRVIPGQKRYRRVKVVRPCVIRLVLLVPIAILVIERYLGLVISLDDVREVYYDQMGIDPWELALPTTELLGKVAELTNLTYTPQIQCPNGQRRMLTVHNPQFYGLSYRKVPNIVHQTAKTRCLTRYFERATIQWAFRKYSFYIHDMDAVTKLLHSNFPEFPQLGLLPDSCLSPPLIVGLWKYLVLWSYGGILADLNTFPSRFNATTISHEDDGFFLLEEGSDRLSTLVMAVSPRHPLMYYAAQNSISNILRMQLGVMYNPGELVGEGALQQALKAFRRQDSAKRRPRNKKTDPPMSKGTIVGTYGRSIRIGGRLSGEDDGIVTPIFIGQVGKRKEFERLGMGDYEEDVPGTNCVGEMLHQVN